MEKPDNATFDWPTPAMRTSAAIALRNRGDIFRQRLEMLRAAMLAARAILADVPTGNALACADQARLTVDLGNAYQILDMALEDDNKLAGPTGVVFDLPPLRTRREVTAEEGRVRVAVTAGPSDQSDPSDDFPIGTPDQIPAERPDPYRWADRLADEAGVVGGQGRSGGEMVTSAIIMIAGAALIAGVIAAAWIMRMGN